MELNPDTTSFMISQNAFHRPSEMDENISHFMMVVKRGGGGES